jgi:hypothetical protein
MDDEKFNLYFVRFSLGTFHIICSEGNAPFLQAGRLRLQVEGKGTNGGGGGRLADTWNQTRIYIVCDLTFCLETTASLVDVTTLCYRDNGNNSKKIYKS